MKTLHKSILIFVLLTSTVLACRNKVPESEALRYMTAAPNGVPSLFQCKDKPLEACLCFDEVESWEVVEIQDVFGDNIDAPIYSSECPQGQESCEPIGYDQILVGKKLVNNPVKLEAYQVKKAASDLLNSKKQEALQEMRKGQEVIAHLRALNKLKNLTKEQRRAIRANTDIQKIIGVLNVGDIDDAREMIQAFVPDGVLLTEEDKAKILVLLQ